MTLIHNEEKESHKYTLDPDELSTNLVKLSKENVAKVEAMISSNSSYMQTNNPDARPEGKYKGSTAYWMTELKKILITREPTDRTYEDIIEYAVKAVDRENSTHLNSDKDGMKKIIEYLRNNRKNLIDWLKYPRSNNFKLIDEIVKSAESGIKHFSFASKFCHYACFNFFKGEEYQDNYSIYDTILKKSLPSYLKRHDLDTQFKLTKTKKYETLEDYIKYCKAIDAIREKRKNEGEEISRNGFDHLIWYYHKGRPL